MCETCHQWQYKANDSCYDIVLLFVLNVIVKNKCTSCVNNAVLNSGSCACSPGYIGTTECTYIPFNVSLVVNKNNTLVLAFSDDLKQNLRNEQILIQINKTYNPIMINFSSFKQRVFNIVQVCWKDFKGNYYYCAFL
ncbi:unnamed protein product [Blepharisma stoltei]|uniref:EGF-like domain-containing protein n=1 Tax=Blepharisma stoltei TaxID=1481888 RepID=A0AAU9IGK7_9CILI|nr:unnamed protein product [Blepharisma stoltei]